MAVGYTTQNGSATAGSDYTAASGTVSFAAGATSGSVAVSVLGDAAAEGNETFALALASPSNATLADGTRRRRDRGRRRAVARPASS